MGIFKPTRKKDDIRKTQDFNIAEKIKFSNFVESFPEGDRLVSYFFHLCATEEPTGGPIKISHNIAARVMLSFLTASYLAVDESTFRGLCVIMDKCFDKIP